jgi:putative hydrolase of the HAD superfamily
MTVRAIICDFYGTLAETPEWGPSWEQLVGELGYELPREVRDRWWNDGIDGIEHDEHSQSRDHYVAWQQSRVRAMLTDCGVTPTEQDHLIERVHAISGHRRIHAYPEVHDVLAALRDRGFTLAICSNWDWDLHEAVGNARLSEHVDLFVSSAWVGARKPHPRIYSHVLEALGVAPDEAIFVGDTWSCDVEGPRRAGLDPVYVRRAHLPPDHTAPDGHEHDPVPRLDDLTGLLDVVASEHTRLARPDRPS